MTYLREWIEAATMGIEALAVAIMVTFILVGTGRWLLNSPQGIEKGYDRYRFVVGKSMQVGLELLVAADIIRTVALDATLYNIAVLGALIVVRTLIAWTLAVEVEGHWPWRETKEAGPDPQGGIHG
ncbi:MAG TPA: DUF1622 domain-containing protein [Bryobacteraceae bacterium]|nr:DUF1622 domain-containing protein [Bryobacteraceae bacterium]